MAVLLAARTIHISEVINHYHEPLRILYAERQDIDGASNIRTLSTEGCIRGISDDHKNSRFKGHSIQLAQRRPAFSTV
jgi:hypothetical protein